MKTAHTRNNALHLAACVAPEDLECGNFVAVLNVVHEFPSFLWCCESTSLPYDEPVQISFRGSCKGTPLKIKAICLPFVFVKTPDGKSQSLDIRQIQFVRLNSDYGKAVWKELKKLTK